MAIYLVRHGNAVDMRGDRERPLSPRGVRDVEALAALADPLGIRPERIVHSGLLRAQQTAEIWARAVGLETVERHEWLQPDEEPYRAAEFLELDGGPVMLCGHLPHMNELLSLLLTGDAHQEIFDFPTSGIAKLNREYDEWRLSWVLTPKLLRALKREPDE